ncbi:hypothetical protein PPYR_07041 [Photinus pyralis]|uniref:Uncharacterized protein n=1 Tax=Photinus pyralis TaxID=7054 RepID=A0A1Y1N269_PHOPY|nr:uncharacterized protein LOC116168593 isoform X2 [Photinus pyralis]XP_031340397.1 uncharacterized protein LOC116168608 isoform X2 [Photinus pyralis]KAB0799161.1 hypothetical protein PPYR_07041 [Photinus pyralis]
MNTSKGAAAKVDRSRRQSTGSTPKTILFRKYAAQGLLANQRPPKRKWNYQMETNGKRIRMIEGSRKFKMGMNSMQRFRSRHHFNGDKRQILLSGSRVRRPNPKFHDFITSSPSRINSGNQDKLTQEAPDSPTVKSKTKVFKAAPLIPEQDPLELMNLNFTEPTDDDVVRSFLPVIDPPKVIYDFESATDTDEGLTDHVSAQESPQTPPLIPKERNTKTVTKNVKPVQPKKIVTSKSNNFDTSLMPPTQLAANTPIILAPHTVTPVIIPQLVNTNSVPIIIATNFMSSPSKTPPSRKETSESVQSKTGIHKKQPNQPSVKTYSDKKSVKKNAFLEELKQVARVSFKLGLPEKKNAKKTVAVDSQKKKETVSRYYLVESEGVPNRTKTKGSNVDFNKLVRTLKSVKLPAANWKIRIVVSRSQTITEVTFTNKEVNERCVKFSRFFTGYVITFGKSVVKLIGAPNKILSYNDVTALLDIVHNLSLSDPVLQYVADKDK